MYINQCNLDVRTNYFESYDHLFINANIDFKGQTKNISWYQNHRCNSLFKPFFLINFMKFMKWYQTYLVAIESSFVKSPSLPRRQDGIGTRILVPVGVPFSSTRTTLFVSNLGIVAFWYCLHPTMYAFFFSPATVTSTLSPILPMPVLLYTWIILTFLPASTAFCPSLLLSTTLTLDRWIRCCNLQDVLQDTMCTFI